MGKNNKMYNPYAKGRWYKFFIESDGNDYTMTTSDIEEAFIAYNYLRFPIGFRVLDHIVDCNTHAAPTSLLAVNVSALTDGRQGVALPAKENFDYLTMYVFGHFGD